MASGASAVSVVSRVRARKGHPCPPRMTKSRLNTRGRWWPTALRRPRSLNKRLFPDLIIVVGGTEKLMNRIIVACRNRDRGLPIFSYVFIEFAQGRLLAYGRCCNKLIRSVDHEHKSFRSLSRGRQTSIGVEVRSASI